MSNRPPGKTITAYVPDGATRPPIDLGPLTGVKRHPRGEGPALITLPDYFGVIPTSGHPAPDPRLPLSNAIAPDALLAVCFGEVRIGGVALFSGNDGTSFGDYSGHVTIPWGEGRFGSIDHVICNGSRLPASNSDAYWTYDVSHFDGNGAQTNAHNETMLNVASTCISIHWLGSFPPPGGGWWVRLPGGADGQEWAADVHGIQLYDPRTGLTAFSANPVLEARWLLAHFAIGVDDASFSAMAQASDDAGFTCNVAFSAKTSLSDALATILQTCNGKLIVANGQTGIYLDLPNAADPVATLSEEDGDIWDLKYEWLSARDRYTQMAVSFPNKDAEWAGDQTPLFGDPGTFSSESTIAFSSVNATTNTITLLSSPGWSVSDSVLFFQNGGVAIPGLNDGATYYVKTISGANVTLAIVPGGSTIDLTGSPAITTQYLQRVGPAYPPTVVVKTLIVNAPGISTLGAAIILRDYLYKKQANTARISGTMNARGLSLQEGMKIHLATLRGSDLDAVLDQIPADAQGFFSFVARPYDEGTFGTTPISQPPPIVPPVPPNPTTAPDDITVTDDTGERKAVASSSTVTTIYSIWQLVAFTLPTNTGGTLKELHVRGFRGTGAATKSWDDMVDSEIVVALAGNEPPPDAAHRALSLPGVVKTIETLTFDAFGRLLSTAKATGPTRIMVKTATTAGALSSGVTVDVAAASSTVTETYAGPADTGRGTIIEQPAGAINGTNRAYTLSKTPSSSRILLIADAVPVNGGVDYTRDGVNVLFSPAANIPAVSLLAVYVYGDIDDGGGGPGAPGPGVPGSPEYPPPVGTADTWTPYALPSATYVVYNDVGYSPDLHQFAAASQNGGIAISNDYGVTWTLTSAPNRQYASVQWGDGKWLACDSVANHIVTSTDGNTWSEAPATGSGITGISRAKWVPWMNLWVGVSFAQDASTSSDGYAWTHHAALFGVMSITLAPEIPLVMMVGADGYIGTSSDLTTWAVSSSGNLPALGSTTSRGAWSPDLGLFLVTGSAHRATSSTATAGSWTVYAYASDGQEVAWSSSRRLWVLVGTGDVLETSPTGLTGSWTTHATTGYSWNAVACADDLDRIVAVGTTISYVSKALLSLS